MASYQPPWEWEDQVQWLAEILHGRSWSRFSVVLLGALFASGRRVVASWIRADAVSHNFQDFYFFLQSVWRRWKELGTRLLVLVLPILPDQQRVLLAIDDSPTKRYGPKVPGAGIHHDPHPAPAAMRSVTVMCGATSRQYRLSPPVSNSLSR